MYSPSVFTFLTILWLCQYLYSRRSIFINIIIGVWAQKATKRHAILHILAASRTLPYTHFYNSACVWEREREKGLTVVAHLNLWLTDFEDKSKIKERLRVKLQLHRQRKEIEYKMRYSPQPSWFLVFSFWDQTNKANQISVRRVRSFSFFLGGRVV